VSCVRRSCVTAAPSILFFVPLFPNAFSNRVSYFCPTSASFCHRCPKRFYFHLALMCGVPSTFKFVEAWLKRVFGFVLFMVQACSSLALCVLPSRGVRFSFVTLFGFWFFGPLRKQLTPSAAPLT